MHGGSKLQRISRSESRRRFRETRLERDGTPLTSGLRRSVPTCFSVKPYSSQTSVGARNLGQEQKQLELDKQKLQLMYRNMLRIRRFEERLAEESAQGNIPGLLHLYVGEEAVAVGACSALRKDDYITSTHRGHGHCIAKGGELRKMMAELFAKETGYCKGRGGSMHIAAPDIGIVGCSGIAGAGIPIAAGVGLSCKLRKTDQVCVSFFGDGASNTGAFHEGMNLAALWELPVVYVLENNLYAISTPAVRSSKLKNISDRAAAYGMPAAVADGMDVLSVYEAVSQAVERARRGEGPTLVE